MVKMALPRGERHSNSSNSLADNLGQQAGIDVQSVSGAIPKPEFEPLNHSVYFGRQRLGRYTRIALKRYAAFDAEDRPLGEFSLPGDAFWAVAVFGEGERR
ncbi:hypothetical protein [uncultured Bradyrhizobium sp.]|jgi:hypothetical protein|uniref:hypothetical protein n=1 Tax=uncultured Bradyrhizobium sp. TaxID=199684 RepID=UPI002632A94D|nr:hypothetical protein [uncultured Bradyrhizobium sp.]